MMEMWQTIMHGGLIFSCCPWFPFGHKWVQKEKSK